MSPDSHLIASINHLGRDHVAYLLDDWPARIGTAYTWLASSIDDLRAYVQLLEAGPAAIRAALETGD